MPVLSKSFFDDEIGSIVFDRGVLVRQRESRAAKYGHIFASHKSGDFFGFGFAAVNRVLLAVREENCAEVMPRTIKRGVSRAWATANWSSASQAVSVSIMTRIFLLSGTAYVAFIQSNSFFGQARLL